MRRSRRGSEGQRNFLRQCRSEPLDAILAHAPSDMFRSVHADILTRSTDPFFTIEVYDYLIFVHFICGTLVLFRYRAVAMRASAKGRRW